jgi:hypothetical protein
VATLTIEIHAVRESGKPAQPTGIYGTVNGEGLTADLVGRPLDRDPGQYVVRAEGVAPVNANGSVAVVDEHGATWTSWCFVSETDGLDPKRLAETRLRLWLPLHDLGETE